MEDFELKIGEPAKRKRILYLAYNGSLEDVAELERELCKQVGSENI